MTDRLALAARVYRANRGGVCPICRRAVSVGQSIVRLVSPAGWCHVGCVPAVRALTTPERKRP